PIDPNSRPGEADSGGGFSEPENAGEGVGKESAHYSAGFGLHAGFFGSPAGVRSFQIRLLFHGAGQPVSDDPDLRAGTGLGFRGAKGVAIVSRDAVRAAIEGGF